MDNWIPQIADLVESTFFDHGHCLVVARHPDGDVVMQKLTTGETIYRRIEDMEDWNLVCRPEVVTQ